MRDIPGKTSLDAWRVQESELDAIEKGTAFMIVDPIALNTARSAWLSVREAEVEAGLTMVKAFMSGIPGGTGPPQLFWSLILIFAYSVLEETLLELKAQGTFKSKDTRLKTLMSNSQAALSWVDFTLVNDGRLKRNEIAHERKRFDPSFCKKYVDAIEVELRAWNIVI